MNTKPKAKPPTVHETKLNRLAPPLDPRLLAVAGDYDHETMDEARRALGLPVSTYRLEKGLSARDRRQGFTIYLLASRAQ